jgi:hypothetical protein
MKKERGIDRNDKMNILLKFVLNLNDSFFEI